jgi:dipeptidyl aminopeptidase/acylaminoacyl peptidase
VAFGADGQRLASTNGKEVAVWEARTGRPVLALKGHTREVTRVAFSPDGKHLASATGRLWHDDAPGDVKVWDAQTGEELFALRGHAGAVTGLAFSPDGSRLATGSTDTSVKIWDAQAGGELLTLQGHTRPVTCLAFRADGERLVSFGYQEPPRVWDTRTGGVVVLSPAKHDLGENSFVASAALSPDGKRIACAVDEHLPGRVEVLDAQTGQQVHSLRGHLGVVFSVA